MAEPIETSHEEMIGKILSVGQDFLAKLGMMGEYNRGWNPWSGSR